MWQIQPERRGPTRALVVVCLVALVALFLVPLQPASAVTAPGGGGEFTAVQPSRVLDTRPGSHVQLVGPLLGGHFYNVKVTGGAIPSTGVLAVAMNVTVTTPSSAGWLTIWPTGVPMPNASNLNFQPGQTLADLVVSGVGSAGQVGIFLSGGSAHVIIDVVGYFASSGAIQRGARLIPVTPVRLYDSRHSASLADGGTLTLPIRGHSVPTSASGVVLNVTVAGTTGPGGFITVWPGGPNPGTSNLNYVHGQARPNLVMTGLGTDGAVRIYNRGGTTQVIVDLVGYFRSGDSATTYTGRVVPLSAPFRAFDTRAYSTRLGPAQREAWNFQPFVSSLTDAGIPVGPIAGLVMNVTTTAATAPSFLTLFPNDAGLPATSNLNTVPGQDIPNLVVVGLSKAVPANYLAAYNGGGYVHYLADVTAVILSD